jgi:hypothetical protein
MTRSLGYGAPNIGEERIVDYFDGRTLTIGLFHDGNQSGHVEKRIRAVDTGTDTIEVTLDIGDTTGEYGFLVNGQAFDIADSTGNDGAYTVSSFTYNYNTERTEITVNESIDDPTADGEAQFGDTNQTGRGDDLQDNEDIVDITTEPNDGGYARQTGQTFEKYYDSVNEEWRIRTQNATNFQNLDTTTGRVDAVFILDNWTATNNGNTSVGSPDGGATDHLLGVAYLPQLYLIDQTTRIEVNANTIYLSIS